MCVNWYRHNRAVLSVLTTDVISAVEEHPPGPLLEHEIIVSLTQRRYTEHRIDFISLSHINTLLIDPEPCHRMSRAKSRGGRLYRTWWTLQGVDRTQQGTGSHPRRRPPFSASRLAGHLTGSLSVLLILLFINLILFRSRLHRRVGRMRREGEGEKKKGRDHEDGEDAFSSRAMWVSLLGWRLNFSDFIPGWGVPGGEANGLTREMTRDIEDGESSCASATRIRLSRMHAWVRVLRRVYINEVC